ncbi:hypothetical protein AeMF1_012631 [Aphanomyces euteiches]|nr:hypothetical protein AeMF1_012631 [Aphanomyces euteiches]
MMKVQRVIFQQLADGVPHDTKEPTDITRDEYVVIHHKVVLYVAAKARYHIPDKACVSTNPRMDPEWMERNKDFDDPFLVDDDELRAAKKKVGQMEEKMLGIKKIKITKAQRKRIEEETMAENKRRAEEMEEQRRSGHDIQNPPYDPQRGPEECRYPTILSLEVDGHILQKADAKHLLNVSDPHDVTYPQDANDHHDVKCLQDARDPHEENDLHDAKGPQDAINPQDVNDPQDETARCRDDDPRHVEDLGADHQCEKPDMAHHLVVASSFSQVTLRRRKSKVLTAITCDGAWDGLAVLHKEMDGLHSPLHAGSPMQDQAEDRHTRPDGRTIPAVQLYIRNIVETRPSLKRATECEIKKALNDVLMKTKGDVNSRLLDFMDQLYTAVKDNCLQQSMEDKDCRKVFIRIAITKIRPLTLQGQVRENYNMEIHQSAEELVEKHAMMPVKREREVSFSSASPSPEPKTKFRLSHDRKDTGSPEASHRSRQGDLQANPRHNQRISKYGPTSGKDDKPKVKFDVKPSGLCYNCRKPGHLMANCPDRTSSSERKVKKIANAASRNRYMQRKKAKRAKNDSGQERFININSALDCLYCPGTGAEIDVNPKSILKQHQAKSPNVEIVQLREPLRGIGCNDQGFEAHAYVELSLTMQTSAGAVRVPGKRKCYIGAEGDELLVSDQTLRLVGINIDRLLAETAQRMANEEDDFETVEFENPRLRRRSIVLLWTARFGLPKPKNELETALAAMVQEACDDGFPVDLAGRLWKALTKHDIWRLKFNGSDPPTKVEPLKVSPREGCEPYRCKGRQHNPLETRLLTLFGNELRDAGVIRHNQQSQWCSPVNPWTYEEVLKYYRLTNDYRMVNARTVPKAGTMPFESATTQHLRGKKAMGTFDMPKCFWQFPLDSTRQDMLSFMLNGWVMTPNCVM